MVDQVFETECWRLVPKQVEPMKSESSKRKTKLAMPPLKPRSASHTSTLKSLEASASKTNERSDTFDTNGTNGQDHGKKKESGGIFRRFASRHRSTSQVNPDLPSSSTLQHSSTINSFSSVIGPSDTDPNEITGKRDRKRRGNAQQEEGKEWRRVRLVLRGDLGCKPSGGKLEGMNRTGVRNESGSKVNVQIFELSALSPSLSFDPTLMKSTDITIPHKSLFPARTDQIIRFCNVPKGHDGSSAFRGPPVGLGAIGWELPAQTGLVEVSPELNKSERIGSEFGGSLPISPAGTSTSRQSTEHWSTPMMSPGPSDGFRGVDKNALPSRDVSNLGSSPRHPNFSGLPTSETIKDIAQCRRMQEQDALGRRHDAESSFSSRAGSGWYGPPRSDASGERIRAARSQASNSSLRTTMTTDSEDSWRSASDGLMLPQHSPISTNFHWTKLETSEETPSVENGASLSDRAKKRESMTPKANRVLQFPDRDEDGLELAGDSAELGETPDNLILTFGTKTETYQWFAMLRSFTQPEYITLIAGNDVATNQIQAESRPSPTLYSAFSVNGSGSKAEWARIWRSLEIKIQDVRDLNLSGPGTSAESALPGARLVVPKRGMLRSLSSGFGQTLKGLMEDDESRRKKEDTLYWSISVDGQTLARTPKRKVDTDAWTETIKLEDIDEWTKCTLRLYRRTRFSGAPPEVVCIGYVRVGARDLNVDGTYEKKLPLLAFLTSEVLGQVRLSMKSDQLNVKGSSTYTKITEAIQSGDAKRIYALAENASVDGGAAALCRIAVAKDLLEPLLCALIDEEVQTPSATLFRSNTPLTRCLEYVMRVQAIDYVRDTIGEDIRAVCADKSVNETGLLTYNVDLSATVLAFWNKIYMSRHQFPKHLRWIFSYLLKAVARYHPKSKSLQLQSVAAFIFLRLVGPCIMWPETFGIIDFHPSENIQQTLKSLAKPIINLGFLTEPKEGDRSPLDATFAGDFHKDNMSAMMDYLSVCSTSESTFRNEARESNEQLQGGLRTRQNALASSEADGNSVLVVARQMLIDVAKDTACLHRIQLQRDATKARRDSEVSQFKGTRTVSAGSDQSVLTAESSSSPGSKTSQFPSLTQTVEEGRSPLERRRRKSRSTTNPRPVLIGPPPAIGQRTSSMKPQAANMVSLGAPV